MKRHRGIRVTRERAATISGGFLAPRIGSVAVWGFAGDQQLAQHMKIASQHTQADVALKSLLRPVAAAFQPIARLQCADRRFDTWMRLAGVAELEAGRLFLF